MKMMGSKLFDIQWIIKLISEQEPHRIDLIEQIGKIKKKKWVRQPYVQFVNSSNPNQEGSEWQFEENIILEHETEGTIILDILKDGRIGGIEFLKYIPR